MSTRRPALALAFFALAVGALLAVRPGARFGETLGFEAFFALLALAFAARSPLGIRARLGLGPSALPRGVLALLALGTLALSFSLDGFYQRFAPSESEALHQFESELAGARGETLAFALLSFALVPGIAEELLCRGLVQRGLQSRFEPATAILLASLFFGALHLDPMQSALAAILGLYLGAIAYLAGSVRASMGCHIANNATAVCAAAIGPGTGTMPTPLLIAAAAFSVGALGWLWRRHSAAATPKQPGARALQKIGGMDDA